MADGSNYHRRRDMPKRPRSDDPYADAPNNKTCDCCHDDLNGLSYATLDGCGHSLCFQCFGEAQANRSVKFKMACPCCNASLSSWKIHTYSSSGSARRSGTQRQYQSPISQAISPPLDDSFITTHPNIYYQHQTPNYRRNYAILSIAVPSPDGGARVLCTELRTDGKNDEAAPETLDKLYYIAKSLSPCLLPPPERVAKSKDAFACMTSIQHLERDDRSPLRRFLHGLAGAADLDDSTTRRKYPQREHNMSFVATEMIRTLKGGGVHHASKLKDFISDNLTVAGVPDYIKDFFSECGLGKSRKYINLAQDRAVDKKERHTANIGEAAR